MAEVTSGKNLTVITLEEEEANALARLLSMNLDPMDSEGSWMSELCSALGN